MESDPASEVVPAVAPAPAVPLEPAAPRDPEALSFHGSGREYFRIWIVNLLLSIVTLGIYSAWAKVRRLNYFYRNTRLAGASFDYHASPIAILKGRIAAALLFGGYTVAGAVSPLFGLAAAAVVGLALPWMLSRSLRFRMHNSSYRGLRFQFHGPTSSAYWVFLVLPVLSFFTFFTLTPFAHHRMKRYQHQHSAYGRTGFTFLAPASEFLVTYLLAISLFVGVMFLAFLAMLVGIAIATGRTPANSDAPPEMSPSLLLGMLPFFLVYASGLLAVRALLTARLQNQIWSTMRLGDHRFRCRINGAKLFGVMWTNIVATVFTLGLFTPFAQIRYARFIAAAFTMLPASDLSEFEASDRQRDVGAYGQEAADFFDFEVGF